MTSSHPDPSPGQWSSRLAAALDRRSAPRLVLLFFGAVLARGRRTVTSWIRAAGLSGQFRSCYTAVAAAGKQADRVAARLALAAVKPLVADAGRPTLALDDTPTPRYGPHVQGAGVHHNPAPGPAGSPFVYGHIWVMLALLAPHPAWGVVALPLLARLYVRKKDWSASTRSTGRRSGPSWSWPSSCCDGRGRGSGPRASRCGWWPTGRMPRPPCSSRRGRWA